MLKAQLVLTNANVYTMNRGMRKAQAVAIHGEKIIGVGTSNEMEAWNDENTQVLDLEGRLVLPGLIDAHAHPLSVPFLEGITFDMEMDLEDMLQAIQEYIANNPNKKAYLGIAYPEPNVETERYTKETLDSICPDKPLLMIGSTFHEGWCNSKALKMAGVEKEFPDPVPGEQYFCRSKNGEPTGRLIDLQPFSIIADAIKPCDTANAKVAFESLLETYRKQGITSVADCGVITPANKEETFALVEDQRAQGTLTCRIFGTAEVFTKEQAGGAVGCLKQLNERFHDDIFQIRSLKVIQDGCLEGRTASCFEPYEDFPEMRLPVLYGQDLRRLFLQAAEANFDVHLHALGDRAIHETLLAAQAVREAGYDDTRIVNAHSHCIRDEDLDLFKKYNVIANFTPQWFVFKQCNVDALGSERAKKLLRMNSVMRTGAVVTIGSDYPSDELGLEPVKAIEMAVTRQKYGQKEDRVLEEKTERVTVRQAVEAYTINAAYQLHMEEKLGSLEEGKYADLIVLDQDIFQCDPYDIHKTRILMTVFNGEVVYDALGKEGSK